jgi:hypothetical protein
MISCSDLLGHWECIDPAAQPIGALPFCRIAGSYFGFAHILAAKVDRNRLGEILAQTVAFLAVRGQLVEAIWRILGQ